MPEMDGFELCEEIRRQPEIRHLPIIATSSHRDARYVIRALRRINAEGQPGIFYLHPWELDPGQPLPGVSRLKLLRHRVGMTSVVSKLDRLFGDFSFAPVGEVLAQAGPMAVA